MIDSGEEMEDGMVLFQDEEENIDEEMMFSADGEQNRYYFYTHINDINIFVEDKDKEFIYETIFKRMFKERYNIQSIFSVGGKPNLEKKFSEIGMYDIDNENKKNIYIADGDFDRIVGKKMIDNENFIYLFDYNIEDYLIDKRATHIFAKGKLKALDSEVENILTFDEWKEKIVEQSFKLFILYSTIQKYNANIQNVERSPYLFISSENGLEQVGRYDKFYSTIEDEIDNLDEKLEEMKNTYKEIYNEDKSKIICGKFLITSLCCHIRKVTKSKFKTDDFIWDSVQHFDIRKLDYVKERIENIMVS